MKSLRSLHAILICVLALAVVPVLPVPVARAQGASQAGPWYRYQGEPSSYDAYDNQKVNCGPTTVAMAIQYAQDLNVPIRDVRAFIGKNGGYTGTSDLSRALDKWGVEYRQNVTDAQSIRDIISRGNIAMVLLKMSAVSPGADYLGRSDDPKLNTGRFWRFTGNHWLVVKGMSQDGKYFQVYDGLVWNGPGDATFWYSNGKPKGLDRYYLASEVERGMSYFRGSRGMEIYGGGRPRVSSGQVVDDVTLTHYTLDPSETGGKKPGDPAYGIMRNGDKVHWGAVAVDPDYIPLGTRMLIDAYPGTVFTAKDTGGMVDGWHVDVYCPCSHKEALQRNTDVGVRGHKITLLGDGPVFADAAPGPGPTDAGIRVRGAEEFAESRYVTLELEAEDATGMMISNNALFTDAFEEPYAPTRQWTLDAGDGARTVYARFKRASGAWSDAIHTTVDLEEQPPLGAVTIAPDPRIILSAGLSGSMLQAIGPQAEVKGQPLYKPLGPNLLENSSFEAWAGGIPQGWDSELRETSYKKYDPVTGAYHGALALLSASTEPGTELTQRVILEPGAPYTLSAWVRGAGGVLAVEELETQGVNSRSIRTHAITSEGGDGWRLISLSFESSPSTTDAAVSLSGTDVRWDSLQLEEATQAGVYRGDGVLLEGGAVNSIANPSMEGGPEGWTGLDAFVSVVDSPDYARYGSKALLVRKEKDGRAATFHPARLIPGAMYTYSVYARLDNGKPVTNNLLRGWYYEGAKGAEGVDVRELSDDNRPAMVWEAAGAGWYRGWYTFTATKPQGLYGVVSTEAVKVGDEYYLDSAQLEAGSYATSYADGSLGPGYTWTGPPYDSPSKRAAMSVRLGRTEGGAGSLLFWARPEGATKAGARLLEFGQLSLQVTAQGLELRSGARRVAIAPWLPGRAQPYAVTWDGERVSLYQAGVLAGAVEAAGPAPGSLLTLGPSKDWAYPNAVVGDVSLWRAALSEREIEYRAGHSPLDPGLETVSTRRVKVVTSAVDTSEGELELEWSGDGGDTWQPWKPVNGAHEWNLGPEDGAKRILVRYTDAYGNFLVYSDEVVLDTKSSDPRWEDGEEAVDATPQG